MTNKIDAYITQNMIQEIYQYTHNVSSEAKGLVACYLTYSDPQHVGKNGL